MRGPLLEVQLNWESLLMLLVPRLVEPERSFFPLLKDQVTRREKIRLPGDRWRCHLQPQVTFWEGRRVMDGHPETIPTEQHP